MKRLVALICSIVLFCIALFIGYTIGHKAIFKDKAIFTTVDHLPESDFKGYTKIYSDTVNDIAVYLKNCIDIKKGTVVEIDNAISGKITEVGDVTFTVEVDDYDSIHYGLSGKEVTDSEGKIIGKVSKLIGEGCVRCISVTD